MFPMARVKEETMTRRPEGGGGGGGEGVGWTRGRRSWRRRFRINMRGKKKGNRETAGSTVQSCREKLLLGGKVITTILIHALLVHSRQVYTGSLYLGKVQFATVYKGAQHTCMRTILVPPFY